MFEHDTRRITFTRELAESYTMHTCEWWRPIDHDQAEHPAAQQQVSGPGTAFCVGGTDDDKPFAQIGPWCWRECATRIDPRDPRSGVQHAGDDLPKQRRFAHRERTGELGDAPSRNASTQCPVERGEAGGPWGSGGPPANYDGIQLGAERSESSD